MCAACLNNSLHTQQSARSFKVKQTILLAKRINQSAFVAKWRHGRPVELDQTELKKKTEICENVGEFCARLCQNMKNFDFETSPMRDRPSTPFCEFSLSHRTRAYRMPTMTMARNNLQMSRTVSPVIERFLSVHTSPLVPQQQQSLNATQFALNFHNKNRFNEMRFQSNGALLMQWRFRCAKSVLRE